MSLKQPSPPDPNLSSPRQRLASQLVILLGYGVFPIFAFPFFKDRFFPTALPNIFLYGFIAYMGTWVVLALGWLVLRLFPSVRFSLRTLLIALITLQIPLSILFAAPQFLIVGLVLLFAWFGVVLTYVVQNRTDR